MLVQDVEAKEVKLENTLVVNEFLDVFLKELPGLSLGKEVKFCLDLILGT